MYPFKINDKTLPGVKNVSISFWDSLLYIFPVTIVLYDDYRNNI